MKHVPDWDAMEREYEQTERSLYAIAKKYGVPGGTVRSRAARRGWVKRARTDGAAPETKRARTDGVTPEAKRALPDGGRLAGLREAAGGMSRVLANLFEDEKQFMRHQYTDKTTGELRDTVLESRNLKSVRDAIAAIRDMTEAVRGLYDLMTPKEKKELALAREKLRIEEKKLMRAESDGGETGVIVLPETDDA